MDDVQTCSHAGFLNARSTRVVEIGACSVVLLVRRVRRQLNSLARQAEYISLELLVQLFRDISAG